MTTDTDDIQYGYALTNKPGDVVGPLDQDTALLRMAGIRQPTQLMVRHDEHSPWAEADDPPEAFVWMPVNRDMWEDIPDSRTVVRERMREALAEKVRAAGFVPDGEESEVAEHLFDPSMMLVKLSVPVKRPDEAPAPAPEPEYGQVLRDRWGD